MELRIAKQQMDREFSKHQLKPGDPGYVYDKQASGVQIQAAGRGAFLQGLACSCPQHERAQ